MASLELPQLLQYGHVGYQKISLDQSLPRNLNCLSENALAV